MGSNLEIPVVSKNGIRGKVLTPSRLLDVRPEKTIIFETGRQVSVPSGHLHLRTNGTYFLDLTVDPNPGAAPPITDRPVLAKAPKTPFGEAARESVSEPVAYQPSRLLEDGSAEQEFVIPRIEEKAEISKRTVETGRVSVEKTAYEDSIVIDEPTIYQEYDVRRIPVNREVSEEESTRVEGDTTIVPVYEEEVVTTKRLILREEIHLVKKRREEHAPQRVTLRKENVDVERTTLERPQSAKG